MGLCCLVAAVKAALFQGLCVVSALFAVCVISLFGLVIWTRRKCSVQRARRNQAVAKDQGDGQSQAKVVGFFHPYCDAGGGGERVLWQGLQALQSTYPSYKYVIFTGSTKLSSDEVIDRVARSFKIDLDSSNVEFVFLHKRDWVEAHRYPYFTLLGQSLGSLVLGWEALNQLVPDIFIDTMGYAFTYPLFKYLGGCRIACYVHYPTISTDMLQVVSSSRESFNNRAFISRSPILTRCKLIYYQLFAKLYGLVGRTSDVIMVNSSWTKGHIDALWQRPERTHLAFPPCDVTNFELLSLENRNLLHIVSVAQFRPEKNHELQIRSFAAFYSKLNDEERKQAKLILIGSCRNSDDGSRVQRLQQLALTLNLQDQVAFKINITFSQLLDEMESAGIGLHSMVNEHFGIAVVECMAAGLLTVAHKSAGPKMDIVTDKVTGFLADDIESYVDAFLSIKDLNNQERRKIQIAARESVKRFETEKFKETFVVALRPIFDCHSNEFI